MDLVVLGIVWRLDLHCRRASGHVALRELCGLRVCADGHAPCPYPQASTEVCMSLPRNGSVGSAQHIRDHSSVTRSKL